MKPNQPPSLQLLRPLFPALVFLLFAVSAGFAKPRPPSPPWPEIGNLLCESFDQPYSFPTNQVIDSSIWAESWSGYALDRTRTAVQPFAVPMINAGTNRTLNFDPERGAIRIWYQPAWSGAWTGQGSGPGELARLLTLVCTNARASTEWWSLVITPDGNELHLVCETESGYASSLSTLINWEAGSWHMVAVGYTPTNSALFVDGRVVARGDGLSPLPVERAPYTSLVVGSDLEGRETAKGCFEQISAFTGRNRFRALTGHPFGMGAVWDVEFYHARLSVMAARGPVSAEEEEGRIRAEARRLELLTAPAPVAMMLEVEEPLDSYDPELGFWLASSRQGTNVLVEVENADTNAVYDLLYAPFLGSELVWNILATGMVGQVSFTIPMTNSQGYFRGVTGADWDGDGVPNWMDADPLQSGVGALAITIESPLHNSTIY